MTALPGSLMAGDIAGQTAVLSGLIEDGANEIAAVRARIEAFDPRFVLIGARGTSDHAALYAKYLVEVRQLRPAGLVSLSTTTVYQATPDLTGCLYLAISQSGGSPDLLAATVAARAAGALTVAITNRPDSELARAAEFSLDIRAGTETSVAATKTYTAQLLTLYLLLDGRDASRLPAAIEATLANQHRIAEVADRYQFVERMVVVGRGYSYPSAREAALKLIETCYLTAAPFSGADLQHGPLAMVDDSVPVLAFTTPSRGAEALRPTLRRLEQLGTEITHIGGPGGLTVVAAGLVEELHPIVEIVPAQLLVLALARLRGLDPDRPRGLAKVTETW